MNLVWVMAVSAQALPFDGPAPEFTDAQAERGIAVYDVSCGTCHGSGLKGGQFGPRLLGEEFESHWSAQPPAALFAYIRSKMPPGGGGSLSAAAYRDVFAYVLKTNGAQPGEAEFAGGEAPAPGAGHSDSSRSVMARTGSNRDAIYESEITHRQALLEKMRPVTDDMLRDPPDGDWLLWRRDYASLGYSPLKQINARNVDKLRVEWSHSLHLSLNEITPLAHDGVLFVHSGDAVQAFDAVNGDLLWEYVRQMPDALNRGRASRSSGVAIYQNTLFVPMVDGKMVALDTKTGDLLWEHEILSEDDRSLGVNLSGVPMVAKGKVLMGVALSISKKGGLYIVALDAQTGEEEWRFNTVARPGQPGGDSWNGLPAEQRFGGAVWTGGSYDPDLDLLYFGVGNTYNAALLLLTETPEGHTNAAAYTEATVALNPDNGKLAWYFQHMKRDVWGMDWAFEQTLVDMPFEGETRKLVVTGGKLAIFDAVDRTDGSYVFSRDVGLQNLVSAIDPETGAKKINPALTPEPNEPKLICPSAGGVRNWPATAYNPKSHVLYVPVNDGCADYTWAPLPEEEWVNGGSDQRFKMRPRPDNDGLFGGLQAIDLKTGKTLWHERRRAINASSVLATAGGLVFHGARDRFFRAQDQKDGDELWRVRLDMVASSSPISYSVNGDQYIAVVTGGGNAYDKHYAALTPELQNPTGAITLWVFRLPVRD